jgi:prepilin-type N-terminal cleavage/methylation domain-containing protein
MYKKLRKQEKGFTIIEVLIVLAIAGVIMLVVFLAVTRNGVVMPRTWLDCSVSGKPITAVLQ